MNWDSLTPFGALVVFPFAVVLFGLSWFVVFSIGYLVAEMMGAPWWFCVGCGISFALSRFGRNVSEVRFRKEWRDGRA